MVESFGGGVADAIFSYVADTPDLTHHLLYSTRAGITFDEHEMSRFASTSPMPIGHFARVKSVRSAVKRIRPAVVHAHSSYAGVYTRLAIRSSSTPIVYTPHCFAFERKDISPLARTMFRTVEFLLAPNTSVLAACWYREANLARSLTRRRPVVVVVNIARPLEGQQSTPPPSDHISGDHRPIIAMAGRLAPQKGIAAFSNLAHDLGGASAPFRFLWIGGGETELAQPLLDAGVSCTGWLTADQVREQLRGADLYAHTAEWEGFPVTVLEAVDMGIPVIILNRPYTVGLPEGLVADSNEFAPRVKLLAESTEARASQLKAGKEAFKQHTPEVQRQQLLAAYKLALP